jgi:hypothetical protein
MGELGTIQAAASNRRTLRRNTNIQEDTILHSHRRENLKSHIYDHFSHFLQIKLLRAGFIKSQRTATYWVFFP